MIIALEPGWGDLTPEIMERYYRDARRVRNPNWDYHIRKGWCIGGPWDGWPWASSFRSFWIPGEGASYRHYTNEFGEWWIHE